MTCRICRRHTGTSIHGACPTCLAGELRAWMTEIIELYNLVPEGPAKQPGGGHAGKRAHSPAPVSMQQVDLLDTRLKDASAWLNSDPVTQWQERRHGILPALGMWLRMVSEEQADDPTSTPIEIDDADWQSIEGVVGGLAAALDWIVSQQWADEFRSAIGSTRHELRMFHGIRDEFKPKCRGCWAPLDPQEDGAWYACPSCGETYRIDAAIRALMSVQKMTAAQIAAHLGIPRERIRKWRQYGLVGPTGRRGSADLYDLDEVTNVYQGVVSGRIKVRPSASVSS